MTGEVLADIYLGNITAWDDPAIAKLNPGVNLPSTKITPVYRSDGSGDTYAFTDYLSTVSPDFKSKVGTTTQVQFPVGQGGEEATALRRRLVDRRRNRLLQHRLRHGKRPHLRAAAERSRGVPQGDGRLDQRCRCHGQVGAGGQCDLARQSAGLGEGSLAGLDVHLRDRPDQLGQG